MNILVATEKPFSAQAIACIKEAIETSGHTMHLLEKYDGKSELARKLEGMQALIVRSDVVDAELIKGAKDLKIIVRAGAGYDNIDIEAASQAGVVVMNTPGQNANSVAELALGLMLFMARKQFTPKGVGFELSGKTLGIQGFGYVGTLIGQKAKALGMKVLAYDPVRDAKEIESLGAESVGELAELYKRSDVLSLNVPLLPSTKGLVGEQLLSLMPQGAMIVNTARKEVVNEAELESIMRSRTDLMYVADVAPDNYEQLREEFGLRVYANSKKMGAQTEQANLNAGVAAAKQIADFFLTGNTKFKVNR